MDSFEIDILTAYLKTKTLTLDKEKEDKIFGLLSVKTHDAKILDAKSLAILFLREHSNEVDVEKFAEALNTSKDNAIAILKDELIEVYFPVVGKDRQKLVKAFVIKLKEGESFSIKETLKDNLTTIEKLINQPFFVFFDENDFAGNSFMLSVAAGLVVDRKEKLEAFSFSGGVSSSGKILSTGSISQKKVVSDTYSKKLITSEVVSDLRELSWILNSTKVHIPFSVALKPSLSSPSPKEAAYLNLEKIKEKINNLQGVSFELIKRFYDLEDDDFVFYIKENMLPETEWESYLKEAFIKIVKIRNAIRDKIVVFHFVFLAPSTFCFGLGAMFGCKEPFVVYHYVAGEYKAVLDYSNDNLRKLKSIVENKSLIKAEYIEKPQENATLAIVIYLASHNPIGDVKRFVAARYENYGILGCEGVQKGNLAVEDWTKYVNEIYSCYNETKSLLLRNRLLFLSVPVPIAFGLGVAIETFEKIDVFNLSFEKATYFKVFTVSSLRV